MPEKTSRLKYHNPRGLFTAGVIIPFDSTLKTIKEANLSVEQVLERHVSGDFGDIDEWQRASNERAIQAGNGFVESHYTLPPDNRRLFVTTYLDRGETALIDPDEIPF